MTLIIDVIITPYIIKRYNAINKKLDGQFLVYFLNKTDINRNWNDFPNIEFKYEFLRDYPFRIKGKDIFTFHINPDIGKKLNELNPKHIISCGWDSFAFFFSLYWAKKNNIRFTLWSGSTEYEKSWRRTITKPLVKWFVNNSNDYIAYGSRAKEYLIKLGANSAKIQIFYNTVDIDLFKKQCSLLRHSKDKFKKQLGINTSFILLFNGQLIKRKGVYKLIKGFHLFQKKFIDISLVIVGSGREETGLKNIVRKDKISNVFFFGFIQFSEIYKFYSVADIFILPSEEEVWGLVINESMACGHPIIISNQCGCTPDLIKQGENGYILRNSESKEIANGLDFIFKHDLHKQNSSLDIIENFKVENILEKINF